MSASRPDSRPTISGFYRRQISRSQSAADYADLYALVVITGVLGIAVNGALRRMERRTLRWLPEHRVSLGDAIAAYTNGGAYQAFAEHESGILSVGRRADLCVLGLDVSPLPALDVADVPVHQTWLGGVPVHTS